MEKCPQCDKEAVTKSPHVEKFQYGLGENAVMLEAHIEVSTCGECGFEFLDHLANEEKDRVVRRHILREKLAEYAHEAWSGWMKHLFRKCEEDGTPGTIPEWAIERWQRQMTTPYEDLSEEEKDSDRDEADRMLALMDETLGSQE